MPFSWHAQLSPDYRLDVSVVKCKRFYQHACGLEGETRGCSPPVDPGAKGIVFDFQRVTQFNRANNAGLSLGKPSASKSDAIFGWQQLPGPFCRGFPEGNNFILFCCSQSKLTADVIKSLLFLPRPRKNSTPFLQKKIKSDILVFLGSKKFCGCVVDTWSWRGL